MRVTRFFAQTFDIYGNSMFATLNFGTIRKKFVRKHCFTKIFIFVCFGFKSYQPYNCCFLDPLTFFWFRKSWIGQYLVFLSVLRQSITVVLNIWFVPTHKIILKHYLAIHIVLNTGFGDPKVCARDPKVGRNHPVENHWSRRCKWVVDTDEWAQVGWATLPTPSLTMMMSTQKVASIINIPKCRRQSLFFPSPSSLLPSFSLSLSLSLSELVTVYRWKKGNPNF